MRLPNTKSPENQSQSYSIFFWKLDLWHTPGVYYGTHTILSLRK